MTIGFGVSDELVARERARSVAELVRAGFTQLDLGALRPAGKFDLAAPDGRLWRRALGVRGEGRSVGLDAYAVDADGMVVWYEAPPASAAQTLAEFEAPSSGWDRTARRVYAVADALADWPCHDPRNARAHPGLSRNGRGGDWTRV